MCGLMGGTRSSDRASVSAAPRGRAPDRDKGSRAVRRIPELTFQEGEDATPLLQTVAVSGTPKSRARRAGGRGPSAADLAAGRRARIGPDSHSRCARAICLRGRRSVPPCPKGPPPDAAPWRRRGAGSCGHRSPRRVTAPAPGPPSGLGGRI
jgi:hypothetical protein